jgi:hypothetical protein
LFVPHRPAAGFLVIIIGIWSPAGKATIRFGTLTTLPPPGGDRARPPQKNDELAMSNASLDALTEDWRKYDALYQSWLAKNPGLSWSHFSTRRTAVSVAAGRAHQTLGANLVEHLDWWEQGRPIFQKIRDLSGINQTAKVCEFGCGSLRVGAHFIKSQQQGGYYGLDIIADFFDLAAGIVGDLLTDKDARLGTIAAKFDDAIAWAPDLVFTTAVSLHIPPVDEKDHFAMLKALAHKPGAQVVFQAYVLEQPQRFARSGWARPVDQFRELMAPFVMTGDVDDGIWASNGFDVGVRVLRFTNPQMG